MPTINIYERDLTGNDAALGTDIPFIPGFGTVDSTNTESVAAFGTPTLVTTVSQFNRLYGATPVTITGDDSLVSAGYDKSYIMAKELLSQGMPVYYYAISKDTPQITSVMKELDLTGSEDIVVDSDNIYMLGTMPASKTITQAFKLKTESAITEAKMSIEIISQENVESVTINNLTDSKLTGISDGVKDFTITITGNEASSRYSVRFALRAMSVNATTPTYQSAFYGALNTELFTELQDKGEYTFKYLTTGGYPNYDPTESNSILNTLTTNMAKCAATRGDVIAIVTPVATASYSDLYTQVVKTADLLFEDIDTSIQLRDPQTTYGHYTTMFVTNQPYRLRTPVGDDMRCELPGVFGYLTALAENIKTRPNWLAIAGTTRGLLTNAEAPECRLSNVMADSYQPSSDMGGHYHAINAITEIKPYGYTIWGNRTLAKIGSTLKASNFLNIRNMLCDLKKLAYSTARSLMFEQNSDLLWADFIAAMTPYLDKLKNGQGISNYKLIRLSTDNDGNPLPKEKFACAIQVVPMYAVEAFDINVVITDEVTVQ